MFIAVNVDNKIISEVIEAANEMNVSLRIH
jgi:hypothetical protein